MKNNYIKNKDGCDGLTGNKFVGGCFTACAGRTARSSPYFAIASCNPMREVRLSRFLPQLSPLCFDLLGPSLVSA